MKDYIRRRFDAAVHHRVDRQLDERIADLRGRLDEAHHRVGEAERRLGDLEGRMGEMTGAVEETRHRSREISDGYDRTHGDFMWSRGEIDRMMPQLAALERRLEDLRLAFDQQVHALAPASPEQAEKLLVEARAEHERARLKLELASHYEERLRRLERETGVQR